MPLPKNKLRLPCPHVIHYEAIIIKKNVVQGDNTELPTLISYVLLMFHLTNLNGLHMYTHGKLQF